MKFLRQLNAIATALVMANVMTACSTVQPHESNRQGLFDRLEGLSSTGRLKGTVSSSRSPQSVKIAFRWPLEHVEVTSPYGQRGRDFHEGIDLRAKSGTPVFAAQSGNVIYAGRKIRGYGNLVVVKHASGLTSIYAHNSRLLVRLGENVKTGQKIAISGKTGHVSGPHLHFEIRDGVATVDPLRYLPKVLMTSGVLQTPRQAAAPVAVSSTN